jgi:hypothetical protein
VDAHWGPVRVCGRVDLRAFVRLWASVCSVSPPRRTFQAVAAANDLLRMRLWVVSGDRDR